MYEGQETRSESYAAFDVSEWVATDDGPVVAMTGQHTVSRKHE